MGSLSCGVNYHAGSEIWERLTQWFLTQLFLVIMVVEAVVTSEGLTGQEDPFLDGLITQVTISR